jgi:hypothetical protein
MARGESSSPRVTISCAIIESSLGEGNVGFVAVRSPSVLPKPSAATFSIGGPAPVREGQEKVSNYLAEPWPSLTC